jgi:hypothetical protein
MQVDQGVSSASASTIDYFDLLKRHDQLFCSFCTDPVNKDRLLCSGCGAIICKQTVHGGRGCIAYKTLRKLGAGQDFVCHVCSVSRDSIPLYYVSGFGQRQETKLTWPLVLIRVTLQGLDEYLSNTVFDLARQVYGPTLHNVRQPFLKT